LEQIFGQPLSKYPDAGDDEDQTLAPRGEEDQLVKVQAAPPDPPSPVPWPRVPVPAPPQSPPRIRLKEAAEGKLRVQLEDLEAILADHVVKADRRVQDLDDYTGTLLQVLCTPAPEGEKSLDPAALLEMLSKIERVHGDRQRDLRRTVELLYRISGPPRPRVQILTATQVNLAGRQGD